MTEYHFFELLKGFRNREKLSQARLADRVGVSRPTLSDWENKRIPARDMILLLAESLTLSGEETNQLLASAGYLPNKVQEQEQKQNDNDPQTTPPDYLTQALPHEHEDPDILKLKDEQIRCDTNTDHTPMKPTLLGRRYFYVGIAAILGTLGLTFALSNSLFEKEPPVPVVSPIDNDSEDAVRFAIIGRYGSGRQPEQDVADLIDSKDVDFVATVGDNVFAALNDESTWHALDNKIGKFYHQYMYPYHGAYGEGAADGQNHFFPLMGNHDYGHAGDVDIPLLDCPNGDGLRSCSDTEGAWYDYFDLPGNERTYSVRRGAVEVVLLSDYYRDPNWDYSIEQNEVIQTAKKALQESTAPWKLLLLHFPPYASDENGGYENRHYDFEAWGADAVIAGHGEFYERLEVEGLPYFVNGAGGQSVRWNSVKSPYSQALIADDYGAMIVDVNQSQLHVQYFTRDGALRDELVLQKSD